MKYIIRSGIVCKKILDETVLFAVGDAMEHCPGIELLNEGAAYYWSLLEKTPDEETMLSIASDDTGIPIEELREGLSAFLKMLMEKGYIMQAGE